MLICEDIPFYNSSCYQGYKQAIETVVMMIKKKTGPDYLTTTM